MDGSSARAKEKFGCTTVPSSLQNSAATKRSELLFFCEESNFQGIFEGPSDAAS